MHRNKITLSWAQFVNGVMFHILVRVAWTRSELRMDSDHKGAVLKPLGLRINHHYYKDVTRKLKKMNTKVSVDNLHAFIRCKNVRNMVRWFELHGFVWMHRVPPQCWLPACLHLQRLLPGFVRGTRGTTATLTSNDCATFGTTTNARPPTWDQVKNNALWQVLLHFGKCNATDEKAWPKIFSPQIVLMVLKN